MMFDATNPLADASPRNDVLRYITSANESLMERLQGAAPQACFVKAFNLIGNAFMVNPSFPGAGRRRRCSSAETAMLPWR